VSRAIPFAVAIAIALGATPALAQEAAPDTAAPDTAATAAEENMGEGEVRMVYEREVFDYGAASVRDPFRPLIGPEGTMGPTFQDLTLRGIIYSTGRGQSVALVRDRTGKIYRARRGDIIGNATVLEIRPLEVLFVVEDFGITRQELLRLRNDDAAQGAQG